VEEINDIGESGYRDVEYRDIGCGDIKAAAGAGWVDTSPLIALSIDVYVHGFCRGGLPLLSDHHGSDEPAHATVNQK
jgi:hypothetical protein